MLTQDQLKAALFYDPLTGIFVRHTSWHKRFLLGRIGTIDYKGYLQIRVGTGQYRAHRLAWLYVYGCFPSGQIDHVDGDRRNNRIANLRDVDARTNSQNQRGAKATNKTGLLGVGAFAGKWRARITIDGKTIQIGTFESPSAAQDAYLKAKRELHSGCSV